MIKMTIIYHSETGNTKRMAELIKEGANSAGDVDVITVPVDNISKERVEESDVLVLGCPTYFGTMSWQMKKAVDTLPGNVKGKLGGVFASARWPGGGYELTEMALIQGMLIRGMIVYSGGVGDPATHFGAVSSQVPGNQTSEELDADRCRKLGRNLAEKGKELFG